MRADYEQAEPPLALLVRGHSVRALEDRFLDSIVGRHLDRVPDRQTVGGYGVVRFVDPPVDRQAKRFGLRGGAQSRSFGFDVHQQDQLKLDAR